MNKNLLVALYCASGLVLLASFMPWLTMEAQIPSNFPFEPDAMKSFMAEARTATGWRGDVTLFGITMPNFLVPLAAMFLALATAYREKGAWNTPPALSISLAAFCTFHLGTILIVAAATHESTDLGFGAILGMIGSLCMLGLTIYRHKKKLVGQTLAGHNATSERPRDIGPQGLARSEHAQQGKGQASLANPRAKDSAPIEASSTPPEGRADSDGN